jgi:hypothetical protein
MNARILGIQMLIFLVQWTLMILGFGLLTQFIATTRLIPSYVSYDRVLDSALKAGIALVMSVFWLYVWDRQVRHLIFKREH